MVWILFGELRRIRKNVIHHVCFLNLEKETLCDLCVRSGRSTPIISIGDGKINPTVEVYIPIKKDSY